MNWERCVGIRRQFAGSMNEALGELTCDPLGTAVSGIIDHEVRKPKDDRRAMHLVCPAGASQSFIAVIPEAGYQEVQMMKLGKTVSAALVMSALLAAILGCQKQEGPAEQAGKKVDKAVEKAGQEIEKAGDRIQDAAKGDKK